jgi:hypothetical protein|tara:strand:+ start:365 stop:553 length:189 start_codon:yes stop_codon:yes gene_type:complete
MSEVDLADSLKRVIEERREMIANTMMDGLLKDIEHYKSLQGELNALLLVDMAIKDYFKENKF